MKRTYEVAEQGDKRGLAEFLKRESQFWTCPDSVDG